MISGRANSKGLGPCLSISLTYKGKGKTTAAVSSVNNGKNN